MPRYCFHSQDGSAYVADHDGTELPTPDAAKAEATVRAEPLLSTRDADAWHTQDWSMIVADESGAIVLRFDVKRSKRLTH